VRQLVADGVVNNAGRRLLTFLGNAAATTAAAVGMACSSAWIILPLCIAGAFLLAQVGVVALVVVALGVVFLSIWAVVRLRYLHMRALSAWAAGLQAGMLLILPVLPSCAISQWVCRIASTGGYSCQEVGLWFGVGVGVTCGLAVLLLEIGALQSWDQAGFVFRRGVVSGDRLLFARHAIAAISEITAACRAAAVGSVCKTCLVRMDKAHDERLRLEYYRCCCCHRTFDGQEVFRDVAAIKLVLDHGRMRKLEQKLGLLHVPLNDKDRLCDFDCIEIHEAGDVEVEQFVMRVKNDDDASRRERCRQVPCVVSQASVLSAHAWHLLRGTFAEVHAKRRHCRTASVVVCPPVLRPATSADVQHPARHA